MLPANRGEPQSHIETRGGLLGRWFEHGEGVSGLRVAPLGVGHWAFDAQIANILVAVRLGQWHPESFSAAGVGIRGNVSLIAELECARGGGGRFRGAISARLGGEAPGNDRQQSGGKEQTETVHEGTP